MGSSSPFRGVSGGLTIIFRANLVVLLLVFAMLSRNGYTGDTFRFALLCDSRITFGTAQCLEVKCKYTDNNSGVSPVLEYILSHLLDQTSLTRMKLRLFPGHMIAGHLKRDAPVAGQRFTGSQGQGVDTICRVAPGSFHTEIQPSKENQGPQLS